MKTVAVVGATGAVGREIISLLEERNFPLMQLRCFASSQSKGKKIPYKNELIPIETLDEHALSEIDLSFFCAGSSVSKEWIPKAGGQIVDSSSAFRSSAPLIIPEINGEAIEAHDRIIASPNCAATILLMPLFPLHRLFRVKRAVVATYQAASGAGARWVEELRKETRAFLENSSYHHALPYPYAFNLFPHSSPLHPCGYVEEELKIAQETRKILQDETIQLSATCVRVPVLRAHSIAANVEFRNPFTLDAVYEAVRKVPGLQVFEDRENNRFASPLDATGKDSILCGRFRIDPSQPNTLEFWSVGDQLRKGAALNAVQIAELILQKL
jgi:aspartate-semialdehyde dehydrogenase